jgi:hypothetical protein
MRRQRYVAKELTHFVGRSKETDEERYSVLVTILKSGLLSARPATPDEASMLEVHADALLSDESMYATRVICFCDIPLDDLEIHMSKFSCFGLSFKKEFLLERGANPVFYIAEESQITRPRNPQEALEEAHELARETGIGKGGLSERVSRVTYFDDHLPRHHHLFMELRKIPKSKLKEFGIADPDSIGRIEWFHDVHIGSFFKPFRALQGEDDPRNYYMEREWRIAGNIRFSLADVYRVILPSSFAQRLRNDVSEYYGQLHFVD